jgi:hypothetical protein
MQDVTLTIDKYTTIVCHFSLNSGISDLPEFRGYTKLFEQEKVFFPCRMTDTVKKLKVMLDKELDNWMESKGVTYHRVKAVRDKLVMISVAKKPNECCYMVYQLGLTTAEVRGCFWAHPGYTMAKKRLCAMRLVEKLYTDMALLIKGQRMMAHAQYANMVHILEKYNVEKQHATQGVVEEEFTVRKFEDPESVMSDDA